MLIDQNKSRICARILFVNKISLLCLKFQRTEQTYFDLLNINSFESFSIFLSDFVLVQTIDMNYIENLMLYFGRLVKSCFHWILMIYAFLAMGQRMKWIEIENEIPFNFTSIWMWWKLLVFRNVSVCFWIAVRKDREVAW